MTIKKMMMAAGAIDEPQVIAPSSNDFDYTFGAWSVAGNALGDHTVGGFIDTVADSGISSLPTFDGDFEITFSIEGSVESMCFGVFAITEDSKRAASSVFGMQASSTASFLYVQAGGTTQRFWYGNADNKGSAYTWAAGSTVLITRVSGVIKFFDDGVEAHEYTATNSTPMRFFFSQSSDSAAHYDDLFFTDTDKVQRDGFINNAGSDAGFNFGDAITNAKNVGTRFKATRTGSISTVKFVVGAHVANFDAVAKLYSDDGTSPASQIGSDSNALTLSSTGTKLLDCTGKGQNVVKGTSYWIILNDSTADGNGDVDIRQITGGIPFGGAGYKDVITDITDHATHDVGVEIIVDASEEPTPGHSTLLLIHSNTSDASTTFVDSSQSGRTPTVVGNTQHDTAQKKFGTTSIYFDGTGDHLTFPDSDEWRFNNTGPFTIDFWMRTASTAKQHLVRKGIDGAWSVIEYGLFINNNANKMTFQLSNNGGTGTTLTSTTSVNDSAWHHIACTRIGNKFELYIDGASEANASQAITIKDGSTTLSIGGESDATNMYTGWLDEVRISRVARWNANFTPPSAPYP